MWKLIMIECMQTINLELKRYSQGKEKDEGRCVFCQHPYLIYLKILETYLLYGAVEYFLK